MITDKIIPRIQKMIFDEMKPDFLGNVGKGYNPTTRVVNGNPIFFVHNEFAFHTYNALDKEMVKWHNLQLPSNFSVKGKHPDKVVEETLEMFAEFCKLEHYTVWDLKPFLNKYEVPKPQNGIENLMSALVKDLADESLNLQFIRVNDTLAHSTHRELSDYTKFLIMQYMTVNYNTDVQMQGSRLFFEGMEVNVRVDIMVKRKSENDNFVPCEITFCFDEKGEGHRGSKTSFKITPQIGNEYGELFTLITNDYGDKFIKDGEINRKEIISEKIIKKAEISENEIVDGNYITETITGIARLK